MGVNETPNGKTKMNLNNLPPLDDDMGWFEETVVKLLENRHCLPDLFMAWMNGQTVGLTNDGKKVYYVHDVMRYINKGGPKAVPFD